jgi:hypothetical protein
MMYWKGCGRTRPWFSVIYYPDIFLEGLRETQNLSQDSRSQDLDFNPGPSEYEAGLLTTQPRRSV